MKTIASKKPEVADEAKPAVARIPVPSKMTAAVLYGSEDLRIEQIDVPRLSADEVLLRVRLALTDGTDLKVWKRGYHAKMIQPPAVLATKSWATLQPWASAWMRDGASACVLLPRTPRRACVVITAAAARKIFARTCSSTTARMPNICAFPGASRWRICWKCRTRSMMAARRSWNRWPACSAAFMKWKFARETPLW